MRKEIKPREDTPKDPTEIPERIIIREADYTYQTPPPFPRALCSKKKESNTLEIFEIFKQVKVNIPLLDMIKKMPPYEKILKDLYIVKRSINIEKKAFLTEHVKTPVKYNDLGCPTISISIGGTHIERVLLDLGTSVNLLPYSVYIQLGLGELKTTRIALSLVDRSVKLPRGIIEDVLVQLITSIFQ